MRLFGPQRVTVQPAVKVRNSVGGWDTLYGGQSHEVSGCTVQPASAEENPTQNRNQLTLRCRGPWPWGSKSRVIWRGRTYDQDGEAEEYVTGTLTRHVKVTLLARTGVV